ncbi:hypothetical protein [Yoonia sp. 2307UL14-13]|uniref:hypothetical protein n=1 Tax=Yoonia sp. 2307UL14-13 TaxID=3126506 RepID=UPI0030B44DCF
MSDLISGPMAYGLAFVVDVQQRIIDAFETETTKSFSDALDGLDSIRPHQFDEVGLSGQSLDAKFAGLNQLSGLVWRGVRKAIKYLLSLVNSILSSLGRLTMAADAIQEMKDLIESKTDFVSDEG